MTTLAYSKKENKIAIDGRLTRSDVITNDNAKKWITDSDGVIYFWCGDSDHPEYLLKQYQTGNKATEMVLNCRLIKASNPPIVIGLDEGEVYTEILDGNFTCGTGSTWATAASDFGKNIKDCVKYATTKDIYSGGKIVVYDLIKQRFVK